MEAACSECRDEVRRRVMAAANLVAASDLLVPSAPGAFNAPLEIWYAAVQQQVCAAAVGV